MKKFTVKDLFCNKWFAFLFTIIIFLSSCYIDKIPKNYIIDYLSIGLSFGMIILYILNFKFSKSSISLFAFLGFIFIATLISDTASLDVLLKSFVKVYAVAFFIEWTIKYNPKNIIKGVYYALYIVVFINFITIVAYPNGMYAGSYKFNWFLGYDNTHIFWYIPAITLCLINLKIKNKKIDLESLILFLVISYSVYYCFSANSVVAYTLFLIYLFTMKYTKKIEWMNSKTYLAIFITLFILFVILRVQNIFSWLIVEILHKDLSFTGRTIVWDNTIKQIKNNFIFGYGMEKPLVISNRLGNAHYVHAHNTILDVLYKGGVAAIIPFSLYIYMAILELYKVRHNEIARILSFAIFSLLIMMLFEARETVFGFYILFTIAYNVKYFGNEYERKELKKT